MQRIAEWEVMRRQARMLERHEKEVAAATEYYGKVVAQTRALMEAEVGSLKRRIEALQKIKESPVKPPAVVPGEDTTSPRSRNSFFQFRQAWPGRKLALKPISGLAKKCPAPPPKILSLSLVEH
jgi:hypothetical protein